MLYVVSEMNLLLEISSHCASVAVKLRADWVASCSEMMTTLFNRIENIEKTLIVS